MKAFTLKNRVKREDKNNVSDREEEANEGFGARRRMFRVWRHSRGSVIGGCLMHHVGGMLLQ